jgi:FAD/FMN-containing dehydrogenase
MHTMKRLIFRGCVGSNFGKLVRQFGESVAGETSGGWRSDIQAEPASFFGSHDTSTAEILHEYFVPVAKLNDFLTAIRPHFEAHDVDLLNITVRDVKEDKLTALRYAREHVFGLVMLFHLPLGSESDLQMRAFTQAMITSVLANGGTYYLPYRLHATRDQFHAAYPQAAAFFEEKRRRDPAEVFTNQFYQAYK